MAMNDVQQPGPRLAILAEGSAERANLRRIILIVLALAILGIGLYAANQAMGSPIATAILGLLSALGVIALIAGATGMVVPAQPRGDDFADLIVANSASGFAVVDETGTLRQCNDAYRTIMGGSVEGDEPPLSPERALAERPEASEALFRLSNAAQRGDAWAEDIRLLDGAGAEPSWLRLSVRPAAQRDKTWAVWQASDISRDSVRQEDTFRELQQIINYLDHAPVGFFSLRPDGRIAYLNATLANWLGLSLDKTTGGAVAFVDIVDGDTAPLLDQIPSTPSGTRVEMFDIDLARADGTRQPVQILHRVGFDADGKPRASRSVVLDRSGGEEGSGDLRAAEVRFARFFNNAPIGIALLDADGSINRVNPAFMRVFGAGTAQGRNLAELIAQDARDGLRAVLRRCAGGEAITTPVDVELPGEKTGQVFLSPVEDAHDGSMTILAYAIETTAQRSLEAQFAQSQKMQAIGQLAGGVAHDFNNVLTAIIGFSDLLLANHRPTDPSFPDIMNIKQNANRAAGLVRQLLAFSRRQTLRPEVLSLTDVVSDLSVLLNRLLGETIDLEVVHGRDLWLVKADLNQFEQVVINLVVNARDAMGERGTVEVRTANVPAGDVAKHNHASLPAADYVMIEVVDSGTGIAKENLEKIFEPFFSTKEVGKGTGLGLSTVYGIIKQTGGYIFADSREGEGATFRIFLPRHIPVATKAEAPAPPKESREARAAKADLTGIGTVLLVEDEDAVRAFASRALEARGYTVLAAQSGEHALELLEDHDGDLDLVVSDVVMPEMDGPTLLKELRGRGLDTKIIFISGYAEDAFRKSLDDDEQFGFLPKPFSLKQLAQAVKDMLEGE